MYNFNILNIKRDNEEKGEKEEKEEGGEKEEDEEEDHQIMKMKVFPYITLSVHSHPVIVSLLLPVACDLVAQSDWFHQESLEDTEL